MFLVGCARGGFDLAWMSEEIERAALADLHKAASTELSDSLGIKSLEIGAAFVSVASALPASAIVLNRAIGVGLSSPETLDTVRQIVEASITSCPLLWICCVRASDSLRIGCSSLSCMQQQQIILVECQSSTLCISAGGEIGYRLT